MINNSPDAPWAALAALARRFAERGWTPATAGNFSLRLEGERFLVTASGRDKGRLGEGDFLIVDRDGRILAGSGRPSAETALHLQVYRLRPEAGAVLHTHSPTQTVASRLFAGEGEIRLAGYELLKAISGIDTHTAELFLPVVANSQDMEEIAARVEPSLSAPVCVGYLIEGHGLYAWGRDPEEAARHLEALDFLIQCELDLRRLHR
ncbi:MAG: methylthioribulose-1-phosphate dehydratase [Lysobacterales bacterium]|jgi:methylthioribulose-1-phosphate dehydratase|nr:MAG: methylthioribulose-1-phosphate dehydratase [Xanthomonadales bacterium]